MPTVIPGLFQAGARAVSLPGSVGSYVSTPDTVANSITGDIDIRAQVAANDYTSGATQVLVAKDNGATQRSWAFYLSNIGNLSFFYTTDGATVVGRIANSSALISVADLSTIWVRATYASATGRVNFYTSPNGASWTLLGVEQTITSGSIFNGTAVVEIGTNGTGTLNPFAGLISRAQIYNGINGTLVSDFNASASTRGRTTVIGSTGETWTLQGSAALI